MKFKPKEGQVDFTNARWAPVINCAVSFNSKILIVKRSEKLNFYPGYWNGVSGFLDDERGLEEKVIDEVTEELNIGKKDIDSIQLCGIFDYDDPDYKKTWVTHAVLVKIKTDQIKLDWEATQYEWISLGEEKEYNLLPSFEKVTELTTPNL